jgi:hypothetical protein
MQVLAVEISLTRYLLARFLLVTCKALLLELTSSQNFKTIMIMRDHFNVLQLMLVVSRVLEGVFVTSSSLDIRVELWDISTRSAIIIDDWPLF